MADARLQTQHNDAETPGQKQARLRRERREAKIKAGGSSRLEKITNVSGRQNLPGSLFHSSALLQETQVGKDFIPPAEPPPSTHLHPDPDEVDLSTHASAAHTPNTYPSRKANDADPVEADIRALLRSGAPQPGMDGGQQPGDEDPMMKMLQQLMGSMPSTGADGHSGEGMEGRLPPGLAAMLGGGMPGMSGPPAQQNSTYAHVWRIIHALSALTLGIYITLTSHTLNGHDSRGGPTGPGHEGGMNVFWVFATAELLLQSSRFFLEKERAGQLGGWMGMLVGGLPEPWKGYLTLAARYRGICSTVVEDGMFVVFIVGAVAWWKGTVG